MGFLLFLVLVIPTERRLPREWRNLLSPLLRQIVPSGIVSPNEPDLLFAPPAFDLLLPHYGRNDIREGLVVHETINTILSREPFEHSGFVFENALLEAAGYAGVENARFARENVNVGTLFAMRHCLELGPCRLNAQ